MVRSDKTKIDISGKGHYWRVCYLIKDCYVEKDVKCMVIFGSGSYVMCIHRP